MNVLILGGAGFIGLGITEFLSRSGKYNIKGGYPETGDEIGHIIIILGGGRGGGGREQMFTMV